MLRYDFIKGHEPHYAAHSLCHIKAANRSGYQEGRQQPISTKQKDDRLLTGLIKQSWLESGGVYGYRKVAFLSPQNIRD